MADLEEKYRKKFNTKLSAHEEKQYKSDMVTWHNTNRASQ